MVIKQRANRDDIARRVQEALKLQTKKEAEQIVDVVIDAVEGILLDNLVNDGFSLKLNRFAKLSVKHKAGIMRKIPFTGDTRLTKDKRKVKFVTLGELRKQEILK